MPTRARARIAAGAILAFTALFAAPPAADAGEAYYLLMFGSQTVPANPRYSHSFATFVRATWPGDGPCIPGVAQVESFTISWLPETLVIRLLALKPECGVNLPLHPTLKYVLDSGERVSLWGPYQIQPELYELAARRFRYIESGQLLYKSIDTGYNSDRVANCIHALSSVVEGGRLRVASPGWGETASYAILRRFMPYVIDCDQTHFWVVYALGLDCYPIIYRDLTSPRSGGIMGPLNRMFGGERSLYSSYGPPR